MIERVVYVLGAGASRDAGGPLMEDFFSRSLPSDQRIYPRHFDYNLKYQLIERLYREWKQNEEPTGNIEGFFQYISFHKVAGQSLIDSKTNKRINPNTVERYLIWYIASYVRHSIAAKRILPKYYYDFALSLKKRGMRYSIVTFNYDLAFEKAIIRELGGVQYELSAEKIKKIHNYPKGIPFIKLHGSLNWLRCPECDRFEVYDESKAHIFNRKRCLSRCEGLKEPVIVPPVPNKEEYLGNNNPLWHNATEYLSDADKVIIIGYSLPQLDTAAIELFRHAIRSGTQLKFINPVFEDAEAAANRIGRRTHFQGTNLDFKNFVQKRLI